MNIDSKSSYSVKITNDIPPSRLISYEEYDENNYDKDNIVHFSCNIGELVDISIEYKIEMDYHEFQNEKIYLEIIHERSRQTFFSMNIHIGNMDEWNKCNIKECCDTLFNIISFITKKIGELIKDDDRREEIVGQRSLFLKEVTKKMITQILGLCYKRIIGKDFGDIELLFIKNANNKLELEMINMMGSCYPCALNRYKQDMGEHVNEILESIKKGLNNLFGIYIQEFYDSYSK